MNLINKDQSPRIEELDEHDPNWHQRYAKPKRLFIPKRNFLIMILGAAILISTAIYNRTEASQYQCVSYMSLVDENGEE